MIFSCRQQRISALPCLWSTRHRENSHSCRSDQTSLRARTKLSNLGNGTEQCSRRSFGGKVEGSHSEAAHPSGARAKPILEHDPRVDPADQQRGQGQVHLPQHGGDVQQQGAGDDLGLFGQTGVGKLPCWALHSHLHRRGWSGNSKIKTHFQISELDLNNLSRPLNLS